MCNKNMLQALALSMVPVYIIKTASNKWTMKDLKTFASWYYETYKFEIRDGSPDDFKVTILLNRFFAIIVHRMHV